MQNDFGPDLAKDLVREVSGRFLAEGRLSDALNAVR